jgi:phage-related protein
LARAAAICGRCRSRFAATSAKRSYAAQQGMTDPAAKPLKGFGGARVMEIVERYRGDAYRAVYTAQFENAVYVLHVFQKKSKTGAATPKPEIELVRRRYADAVRHYKHSGIEHA